MVEEHKLQLCSPQRGVKRDLESPGAPLEGKVGFPVGNFYGKPLPLYQSRPIPVRGRRWERGSGRTGRDRGRRREGGDGDRGSRGADRE